MRVFRVVPFFLLAACSSTCPPNTIKNPSELFSKSGSIHMMLAKDGTDGTRTYVGSGRTLSKLLYKRILTVSAKTELATHVESRDDAVAAARAHGINYLFEPVILKWMDPVKRETGGDNYIAVRIGVWDVATGEKLASGTFSSCNSKLSVKSLVRYSNPRPRNSAMRSSE